MIKAVIMAGGSGTRLWPLSRSGLPKQFLRVNSKATMLQETFNRLNELDISSSVTICNEQHRFFVAEQLREIDKLGSIILEPVGKNTAPAIAISALIDEEDPLLLVLPSDHIIENKKAFHETVRKAIPLAEAGKLVTFGIPPSEAQTGYGYIKIGNKVNNGFYVNNFVEKPSYEVALDYFESGDYFWNSGIFLFKASRYLEELDKFRPDIYEVCKKAAHNTDKDFDFIRIDKDLFAECPSESIDYAVMEKTNDAVLVVMDVGWNDIGSWSSLWDVSDKDNFGNVVQGDVLLQDSNNCYVSSDNKLVTTIGVDDLIVVDTKDVVMVAHKNSVQNIKMIVKKLKDDDRSEWESHREVYRPWGKYDCIDKGTGYLVKRITVNPGAKLSLQKHHYREEHWIVVSGTAKVKKGNKTFTLSKNESTYIPKGEIHSLENPEEIKLELIEVQSGSILDEKDIIRFEDMYGRANKIKPSQL